MKLDPAVDVQIDAKKKHAVVSVTADLTEDAVKKSLPDKFKFKSLKKEAIS